jgi:hypothetical protein
MSVIWHSYNNFVTNALLDTQSSNSPRADNTVKSIPNDGNTDPPPSASPNLLKRRDERLGQRQPIPKQPRLNPHLANNTTQLWVPAVSDPALDDFSGETRAFPSISDPVPNGFDGNKTLVFPGISDSALENFDGDTTRAFPSDTTRDFPGISGGFFYGNKFLVFPGISDLVPNGFDGDPGISGDFFYGNKSLVFPGISDLALDDLDGDAAGF